MCVACGEVLDGREYFCESCDDRVEKLPPHHCHRCADPGDFEENLCPRCRVRPPAYTRAYAPFVHDDAIARAIHRFKYEDHPELARPLGRLLAKEAKTFFDDSPGQLCAIPLHRKRFHQRKYDQSELLVGELAALTSRPPPRSVLARIRETERQVGLTESERESNVSGAFLAQSSLAGRIILVDDVLTTGATADAAARALIRAGAEEVRVITLARATIHNA